MRAGRFDAAAAGCHGRGLRRGRIAFLPDPLLGVSPLVLSALGFGAGAIFGSFIAAILIRWPQERSVLRGRSACDSCGQKLRAIELIPLLSYLAQRGRCRRCGAAIDTRHVGIELAAGVIGAVALFSHPNVAGIASALFGWWLLLIGALDGEHHWLPDVLTLPLLPIGLIIAWIGIGPPLEQRLIGAIVGFAALTVVAFLYCTVRHRHGLGGGDPKLFAAIGAWLGWVQLPFVLLGAGLFGLAAVLLARFRGRRLAATDSLPFGTLMALAAWPIWLLMPL